MSTLIETIDFSKIKEFLCKEEKKALAYEFISAESSMYEFEGDDHPSVYLHRFVFNLFCKDGASVEDFIQRIIDLHDEETPNEEDFDFPNYVIEKSQDLLDI